MKKKLEVKDLRISFRTANGKVQAVRDISFDLYENETLAIVGESGSGKSVTTRAILGISALNAVIENGEILYEGDDLLKYTENEFQTLRGDKIAMIFQDPMSSLNPIVKVGKQLTEAMLLKSKSGKREAKREFYRLLRALQKASNAETKELFRTFIDTEKRATRMENLYKQARENAEEANTRVESLLVAFDKKESALVQRECGGILRYASASENEFLPDFSSEEFRALLRELKDGKPGQQALVRLGEILSEQLSRPAPDFFTLAFTARHPEKNSAEFESSFSAAVAAAAERSHAAHCERQARFAQTLRQAGTDLASEWNRTQVRQIVRTLSVGVRECIDPVCIDKDSTEYTFEGCVRSCYERYFFAKKKNAAELKKFKKRTARRNKLLSKGKQPEWKVPPAATIDTDLLKKRMTEAVSALQLLYEKRAKETFDAKGYAERMVAHLKGKASQTTAHLTKNAAKRRAIRLLNEVGIPEPEKRYAQYPFQLSGGQRQRIVIAIALSADPDVLICDEPTTALDVTIQAQILELINKIKRERNLSVIFITHDLGVVANIADRIAVMYAGKIVEYGTSEEIFYSPAHPYTWALLSSVPDLESKGKLEAIPGTPPNMIYPPQGDAFAERNRYALEIDFKQQPPMFRITDTHYAATWLRHPLAPKVEMPQAIKDRIRRMKEEAEHEQ